MVGIRQAEPTDIEAIVALWRELDDVLPSVTDDDQALGALLTRDRTALIVAEDRERIVGTLIAGWDGWRGNLYRLAVHPAVRHRGIAKALVRRAETQLSDQGCRRVAAVVAASEPAAVGFWTTVAYEWQKEMGRFVKNLEH